MIKAITSIWITLSVVLNIYAQTPWQMNGNHVHVDQWKIGIGKDNPLYDLDVDGVINADQVFIQGQELVSPWNTQASVIFFNAGNVGIGTNVPDSKLTINGAALSKEVIIDLNTKGPDYVFKDEYPLMSLEELKTYIDKHKHLPYFPSAEEMKEGGVDIGSNQINFLKSVEELVLHQLELN
ncbi:MAG: hypothetical protein AAFY41_09910, partial [Bacteroidota bacterium]